MARFLYPLNIIALVIFLAAAFVLPLSAESQARASFTQLDREGTIKVTSKARSSNAPLTIAGSAITSLRTAVNIGMAVALANVALPFAANLKPDKKKK